MSQEITSDSIYRTVFESNNVEVRVYANYYMEAADGATIPLEKYYKSKVSKGGKKNIYSVSKRAGRWKILLASKSRNVQKSPSVMFGQNDLTTIKMLIAEGKRWFLEAPYRNNLFEYDKNGIPLKVSEEYENFKLLMYINDTYKDNFICIRPAVITNVVIQHTSYPGIIVSTNEGTICSVTYTEFNNIFESIHSNLSIISLIADSLYNEEENKRKFKRIEDKLNIILSRLGVN